MGLFYGLLQIAGWVEAGYWLAKHNYWATIAFVMCTITIGMTGAISEIMKKVGENGSTNQSK